MGSSASPRELGDHIAQAVGQSGWRLLGLCLGVLGVPLAAIYLWRGLSGAFLVGGAVAGGVAFLVAFAHPFATLLACTFILFSGLDGILPGPVAAGLAAIVAARLGFDALGGRRIDWGTAAFRVSLTLLFAIALSSLVMARSLQPAERLLWHILWGLLLFTSISTYADSTAKLAASMLTVSVALGVGVVQLLVRFAQAGVLVFLLHPVGDERVGVLEPNLTAVFACCLLFPLVHVMERSRGWRRWLPLPAVALLVVAVILAVSRIGMALLGLAVGILLIRGRRSRPFVVLGLAGLGLVLLRLPEKYWLRFVSLGQLSGIVVDRSLQLRQHALEAGWSIFCAHPWLGVGLGNFSSETPRYMSVPLWAHNTYLDVAATLGIFGLVAFVGWQVSGLEMVARAGRLWRVAGRRRDASMALAVSTALVFFYLGAFTLDLLFHPILWLFFAWANAARRCAESGAD
jgi:O-antigen ligase